MKTPWVGSAAVVLGILVIGWHYYSHGQQPPLPSTRAAIQVVQGISSVPKSEERTVAAATVAAISPQRVSGAAGLLGLRAAVAAAGESRRCRCAVLSWQDPELLR